MTQLLPTRLDPFSITQLDQSKLSNGRTRSSAAIRHSDNNSQRRRFAQCLVQRPVNDPAPNRYQRMSMISSPFLPYPDFPYKLGGSLAWDDPSYLRRQADLELQTALDQGQFSYVLGPRQIGKSSLRIQAAHRLMQAGDRCASVQATQLQNDSEKDFLYTLYTELVADNLQPFLQWVEQVTALSPVNRLIRFVDDFLTDSLSISAVVVFIDEIDAILDTPLNSILFAWMAKCLELRGVNPIYQRLNFVVLGSAIANDLPLSSLLLPQGCEILLAPFKLSETCALQAGFEERLDAPHEVMSAVYRWTYGQPFLTQKLCHIISSKMDSLVQPSAKPIQLSVKTIHQWVDEIVRSHIIQDWQTKDEPIHLRAIGRRINTSFNRNALLSLYREVYLNQSVKANNSYTQAELILSGLVIAEDDYIQIANEIYRSIFPVNPAP